MLPGDEGDGEAVRRPEDLILYLTRLRDFLLERG